MRYLGGKSRIANQIAAYINNIRKPGQTYWEPFVGGGSVLARIHSEPIFASDIHPQLIKLWLAVQSGWVPPEVVTEEDRRRAKNGEFSDALTAFIGFGASWGGCWFSGLSKDAAKESSKSIVKKFSKMTRPHFFEGDFLECLPPAEGCLIYCDPPYEGTTSYNGVKRFDTLLFWQRVRELEDRGHTVVVSEYQAPDDFGCVWELPTKINLTNGMLTRIERLFRFGSYPMFQGVLWEAAITSALVKVSYAE
jgi:DNA adenine methylase